MDIANLVIRVTNEGLTAAQRELRRLRDSAGQAQSANERFGQSIQSLNRVAMVSMGALAATVGGSVKTAMAFESAMAEVNKTVDFASKNGLANMRKEIEGLTKEIPQSFEELAGVAAVAGQLGIAEDKIVGFTETIAKMGVAFDMTSADAADSMAKIANVFALPIENIGELGDTINTLSNSMASTAPNIIDFMQRSASLAKTFKLSADETAAFGSALVALGWQPEVASTAFNSMIMTLSDLDGLNKSGIIGLQQLGLDTLEFAEIAKTDGKGAILEVIAAVNRLDESSRIAALSNLFGKEAAAKIASMATGLDTVNGALAATADTAGSMQAEFEAISATTANKFQLMQNNVRSVAASVGDAFIPALNDLLISLTPTIEKVTAWAKANPELIVTIAKVVGGISAAIIAMAAISGAVSTAVSAFTGLKAIFVASKVAIMALSGPIGLTAIALGILVTAGALVYQNWELIKQKATEIWGAITSYISDKVNAIKSYFSANFPAMTAIVSGQLKVMWSVVSAGFALIKNAISTVLDVIKAVIKGDFSAIPNIIKGGLQSALGIVSNMMGNILNIIKATGSRLFQVGKDLVQGLINGIKSSISGVTSAISDMASNAVAKAKSVLKIRSPSRVMMGVGSDFSQGFINGIKGKSDEVAKAAIQQAQSAVDGVKNSIASLQKQQALFGNSSSLASLLYDIENTDKYKDVSKQLVQQLVDENKALEQMNARAKAALAIQDRLDALKRSKADAKTGLQDMLGSIEQETPLGKIQAEYEERLAVIEKYEQMHTDMIGVQTEARLAAEKSYMDAKRDLMLTQGEELFGNLAGLSKTFLGEQSAMYKSLFAIEKGYTLAKVLLKNEEAIAEAWASAPFPYNLPAVATTIAGTQGIASAVAGIMPKGFKQGGYTGNMGTNSVAGVVHGQEYVFDAQATKRIGVDNLNAMRSGQKVGGDVNISVTVDAKGNSSIRGDNERMGRDMANGIKAVVMDVMRKEKRQGGMLYGA